MTCTHDRESELFHCFGGLGNDFLVCAGQMKSAQNGVKRDAGKQRPPVSVGVIGGAQVNEEEYDQLSYLSGTVASSGAAASTPSLSYLFICGITGRSLAGQGTEPALGGARAEERLRLTAMGRPAVRCDP